MEMEAPEKQAIEAILENWNKGWQTKNAALATQDYAEDADFTNAFGMARHGRAEIEELLSEVFQLPFVIGAESETVEQSIRFIRPDVALTRSLVLRKGQKSPSGEDLGLRSTSSLRVFLKMGDGWRIVSHLISDARDRGSSSH